MSEELSLPRLPAVSWNEETQTFSNNPKKRVRARRSSTASAAINSSDPAVFSSDDDPALDNYIEGRKKRKYVGSWFRQEPVASEDSAFEESQSRPLPKTRRTFKRQIDSGVWMGSDGTDDGFEELQLPLQPKLSQLAQPAPAPPRVIVSAAEHHARSVIQMCLDDGEETVDLSSTGLETLSNATIEPLANLTCIPLVAKDVPFEHRPPSLKLLLSGNLLQRVPGAVFDLEHLTVLSLRGCGLKELPPAIGRLSQLQYLNLAQNHLTYLPAELLNLIAAPGQLTSLLLQGNNFWQATELPAERPIDHALREPNQIGESTSLPEDGLLKLSSCSELTALEIPLAQRLPRTRAEWSGMAARYLARSAIQRKDATGRLCSGSSWDNTSDSGRIPTVTGCSRSSYATPPSSAAQPTPTKASVSSVPSLLELAARSCYACADLEDLAGYIPESLTSLRAVLENAAAQRAIGGYNCWRCQKTMVTPATEWLEWWQVARVKRQSNSVSTDFLPWSDCPGEQAVPFLWRGCSWACIPEEKTVGAWTVKDVQQA